MEVDEAEEAGGLFGEMLLLASGVTAVSVMGADAT
jgi:hypothetical protein